MYFYRFGLNERPFAPAPDPSFMSWTPDLRRTFDAIRDAIVADVSAVLLTGRAGLGKTTLLKALAQDTTVASANTVLHVGDVTPHRGVLLRLIADAALERSGLQAPENETGRDPLSDIAEAIRVEQAAGRGLLIMLDGLEERSAEALLDLNDLASDGAGLTLVVAGQPGLRYVLDQLADQGFGIPDAHRHQLEPLRPEEGQIYVADRLERAGGTADIFTPRAVALITQSAVGVPRKINTICSSCLSLAFSERRWTIDHDLATRVVADDPEDVGVPDPIAQTTFPDPHKTSGLRTVVSDTRKTAMLGTVLEGQSGIVGSGTRVADNVAPAARQPVISAPSFQSSRAQQRKGEPASTSRAEKSDGDKGRPVSTTPDKVLLSDMPVTRNTGKSGLGWFVGATALAATLAGIWIAVPISDAPVTRSADAVDGSAGLEVANLPSTNDDGTGSVAPDAPAQIAPERTDGPTDTPEEVSEQEEFQVSEGPVLDAIGPTENSEAEALKYFRAALNSVIPQRSAVDFARGAMRGHRRSAVYLGQKFETGDGVTFAPTMAARWYAVADSEVPRSDDFVATPKVEPIFAAIDGDGIDFVWDGVGDQFTLEVADADRASIGIYETPLTAVRLADPGDASFWRVAIASDTVSDWMPISPETGNN